MTEPADAPQGHARRPAWLMGGKAGPAALAVSVAALALAALPYVPGGPFGTLVRNYLLTNPQVLDEVVAARESLQETQRVAAINAAVSANPALLSVDPRDPAYGPANAKVTVIEFFDYRCPGCKSVSEDYLRLMQANPDVRFVFKEWPILDRGDDTTSNYAARAALAAHRQGKYLPVHQALMATPSLTPEGVDRVLAENGVAVPNARAVAISTDVTRHIADIQTTAGALQLFGTPTFFINGKASPSIDPRDVARMIAEAK